MKNVSQVMGLLFGSAGAHTYPKSGLVASSPFAPVTGLIDGDFMVDFKCYTELVAENL